MDKLADDDSVKALIVRIDSPGGSVAGGESLHDAIAHVAAKKPVVAVMGGLAASAGYMIAVPAARIFAHEATLTGSIGVLLEAPEVSGLLAKIGVDAQTIVSGPLKDQPSFTQPLSPQGQRSAAGAGDGHVRPVRRAWSPSGATWTRTRSASLATDAPIPGGRRCKLGLIDAIGGEQDAREWLASTKGVSAESAGGGRLDQRASPSGPLRDAGTAVQRCIGKP